MTEEKDVTAAEESAKEGRAAEYMARIESALESLTGYDYEAAETEERAAGNMTPDIGFSKRFQARLAARALSLPLDEIQSLKANEYATITTQVSNFLLGNLAEMVKARQMNTGK